MIFRILVTFLGAFSVDRIHYIVALLLCLDHVGEMVWYIFVVDKERDAGPEEVTSHTTRLSIAGFLLAMLFYVYFQECGTLHSWYVFPSVLLRTRELTRSKSS